MTVALERAGHRLSVQDEDGPAPAAPAAPRQWQRELGASLQLLDAGLVLAATGAAVLIRFGSQSSAVLPTLQAPLRSYGEISVVLALGWVLSLALARAHEPRVLGIGAEEFKRIILASLRFWGIVAIACFVGKVDLARGYVAVAFPLGTVLLLGGRYASRKWLHVVRARTSAWSHRVLVVGDREHVDDLVGQLRRDRFAGFDVVGACLPGAGAQGAASGNGTGTGTGTVTGAASGLPVMGGLTDVPRAVEEVGADTVAVASSRALGASALRRLGWSLEGTDVDLVVAPSLVDVAGPRVHVRPVAGLPLLYVEQPEFSGLRRVVKGVFDRVAAALGLVAVSPLLLAVAVAVRLDSQGPVLFRQTRVGRGGTAFTLLKFRTMGVDAEERLIDLTHLNDGDGPLFKMRADPRVTRVGRFLRAYSLDELPQLVNVLLGHMSLVGPRPPLPGEVDRYDSDVRRRLLVKPGITGLWQVSGRSDLPWEEATRLDLYYVENWSFTGDLMILWKTARAVVDRAGAY